jgi:hypothetical protein
MSEAPSFISPEFWEEGQFDWEKKVFYTVPLSCMLGTPNKLSDDVARLRAEIASKGYTIKEDAMLLMQPGFLKGQLMINIMRPKDYDASVMELEKSKIFSAVHNGPLKTAKKQAKELAAKVQSVKGLSPTNTFIWDFRNGPAISGQRSDRFVVICQL